MEFVLASASPRRRELIKKLNIPYTVMPSEKDEIIKDGLTPVQVAENLAQNKAEDVFLKTGGVVIGADTVVVLNGKIIGKPVDKTDAINTLKALSGKTHQVITGYCVMSKDKKITGAEITEVTFNDLTDEEINAYVCSGLCFGKAGSYGIQDGYNLVKSYAGSYDNVVGFPTERLKEVVKEFTEKR